MKTIYIVTSGSYSDYSIEGVWDNQELAEKHAALIYDGRVEEYALNEYADKIKQGLKCFRVFMDKAGNANVNDTSFVQESQRLVDSLGRHLEVICYAKDDQHAIKIANEKRIQLIAGNMWE